MTVWEEHIVETDDPRWIAAEENTLQTSDVMDDRACDLVNIKPTTIAGLAALLIYVATVEKEGDGDLAWPPGLVDEEEDVGQRGKSWSCFLHSHLADSLQAMATGVQS